jgi:23S rRNA-/tRNA-specific pseudouridylate synthase
VFNLPFQIIFQNEEIIVINKPPSIPVHPCGQFHYNSVVGVMEHEMGIKVERGRGEGDYGEIKGNKEK